MSWPVNLPPCKVPPWEIKPLFCANLRGKNLMPDLRSQVYIHIWRLIGWPTVGFTHLCITWFVAVILYIFQYFIYKRKKYIGFFSRSFGWAWLVGNTGIHGQTLEHSLRLWWSWISGENLGFLLRAVGVRNPEGVVKFVRFLPFLTWAAMIAVDKL